MDNRPSFTARCLLLAGILLVSFTAAFGQSDELKIKNTAREIRPGLYECIVYFEISKDLSQKIDDVTYTFPFGYANRKHKGKRIRSEISGFFSSRPIITAEELVVNIKIDYKGSDDVYMSYKIKPFTEMLK